MAMRIAEEAKRAMWAMDLVEHGLPSELEEQAALLLELNRISNLISIRHKLTEGWGIYIYDEVIKRFGEENAATRIRNARNTVLSSLAKKSIEELKTISKNLRKGILEQRITDYEPSVRPLMTELYKKLYEIGDFAHLKINLYSVLPMVLINIQKGKNVFAIDKFYVDDATKKLFENEAKAAETLGLLAEGVAYLRGAKSNWETLTELERDSKAITIAKGLYKLFLKNANNEALGDPSLRAALELFNDGLLEKGIVKLRNHQAFSQTMKNMTNVYLAEFEPGYVDIYSAEGKCRFYFDDLGRMNIVAGIKDYNEIGISYLYAATMIYNYIVTRIHGPRRTVFDNNMRLCTEALDKNEPSEVKKIQSISIEVLATAGFNKVLWIGEEKPKNVGQAVIGVQRFEITMPESRRRIKMALTETALADLASKGEFVNDEGAVIYSSLLYANATILYPETGIMDYNFYTTPAVEVLFDNFGEETKFDRAFAEKLNKNLQIKTTKQTFRFEAKEGYNWIIGSISSVMVVKERTM